MHGDDKPGMATAVFLGLYVGWLLEQQDYLNKSFDWKVPAWYMDYPLSEDAKRLVTPNGEILVSASLLRIIQS